MQSVLNIARADWGAAIHAVARRLAYVVAILIVAAELAYRAGLATGRAVHWLSDRLAGLASGRIDRAQAARAVVAWAHAVLTPEPAPEPAPIAVMACAAAPVAAPSVAVAPPALDTLTVADLRRLARARGLSGLARKGRRADLLAALQD